MFYKFSKVYTYIISCSVEADSFEEARQIACDSDDWYKDEEDFCESCYVKECDDEDDIDGQDKEDVDYYTLEKV